MAVQNKKQADLRSQSLDLLRFPLAIAVLAVHVVSPQTFYVKGEAINTMSMPAVEFLFNFISAFIRAQSVPIYYFISGYVFFYGVDFTSVVYKKKLKNRFRSLVIPYVVWNVFALAWILFKSMPCFASLTSGLNSIEPDFSLKALLFSFFNNSQGVVPIEGVGAGHIYPVNSPLWFIRDLIIVVITSPIVYWIVKKIRVPAVVVILVLWFIADYYKWGYASQLITAYAFFMWGAYMSVNKKDMMAEFGRFSNISYVGYFALAIAYMVCAYVKPEYCTILKLMNIFVGLIFAYNVAALLIKKSICKPDKFLSSSSFFIYISHFLIYNEVLKILYMIISPETAAGFVLLYLLAIVACVLLLLSMFYLMNRYVPSVLRVIAGRK